MIVIRIEDEHSVVVFDEETAIDADDCVEVEAEFDELTIEQCLHYYNQLKRK